ncbi:MAG: hypothetical protein J6J38_11850, partial [Lachnospiraceae bacterium]|nr:hypothetical protein [Lachnospiraceae bacterium]
MEFSGEEQEISALLLKIALLLSSEGLDSVNSFSQISFQPLGCRWLADYDIRQRIILQFQFGEMVHAHVTLASP